MSEQAYKGFVVGMIVGVFIVYLADLVERLFS